GDGAHQAFVVGAGHGEDGGRRGRRAGGGERQRRGTRRLHRRGVEISAHSRGQAVDGEIDVRRRARGSVGGDGERFGAVGADGLRAAWRDREREVVGGDGDVGGVAVRGRRSGAGDGEPERAAGGGRARSGGERQSRRRARHRVRRIERRGHAG